MKKGYIVSLLLLVSLSGCKRKYRVEHRVVKNADLTTNVDIPMAEDGIRSFFDDDINEFTLADETEVQSLRENLDLVDNTLDAVQVQGTNWRNAPDTATVFKKVYFDFNSDSIRADQASNVEANINLAKAMISTSDLSGKKEPVIIIDGHACNSAGSRVYNLALSEKRAKVLADTFVEAGVPSDLIKIVGRGSEVPALVNGKPCQGNRVQQSPNRRDEVHLIYS